MTISSLSVLRGYREYISRRLGEQESFISLFRHLEESIARYLTPPSDALRGFSDGNLERVGFFKEVFDGKSLSEAFEDKKADFSLGKESKTLIARAFSVLSNGYRDEVIAEIRGVTERLEKILSEEREELQKNEKVASVVTVAVTLGIFILLV